jgi:hypothetical protein
MHFQGMKSIDPYFILKIILLIILYNYIISNNSLYTSIYAYTYKYINSVSFNRNILKAHIGARKKRIRGSDERARANKETVDH